MVYNIAIINHNHDIFTCISLSNFYDISTDYSIYANFFQFLVLSVMIFILNSSNLLHSLLSAYSFRKIYIMYDYTKHCITAIGSMISDQRQTYDNNVLISTIQY